MLFKLLKLWPKTIILFLLLLVATPFVTRIKGGDDYAELPMSANNFEAYSLGLHILGRCYLLAPIRGAVVEAYGELEKICPEQPFIYAEMGWKGGGRFDPHRTHREEFSADFITPMQLKSDGSTSHLPTGITNRWGYDLRLDKSGCFENMCIDTNAVILHVQALERATHKHGHKIKQIIFDPTTLALLKKHQAFSKIKYIRFMEGQAWFPHDGHYHIDFEKLT